MIGGCDRRGALRAGALADCGAGDCADRVRTAAARAACLRRLRDRASGIEAPRTPYLSRTEVGTTEMMSRRGFPDPRRAPSRLAMVTGRVEKDSTMARRAERPMPMQMRQRECRSQRRDAS